jgi:transcriptional regulator with PAS, ATPase and Fis domain
VDKANYEPITVIINSHGIITFATESYAQLTGLTSQDLIGRHIHQFSPHSHLPDTAKRCKTDRQCFWSDEKGLNLLVSRYPLTETWGTYGAIGMVDRILNVKEQHSDYYSLLPRLSLLGAQAKQQLECIAKYNASALLLGETGVGKEVFARALHELSDRNSGPFIKLNCAAINSTLVESELFGYDYGAFTGAAKKGHKGKFEQAHNGTLFLDEIGELPLAQQVKLLRVLQEGQVDRLGAEQSLKVDVRVISATNRSLSDMVLAGTFRRDLYYRLNIVQIHIPALRDQPEDIPVLIQRFWDKICHKYQCERKLSLSAIDFLLHCPWPGNIRELKNTLERIYILTNDTVIKAALISALVDRSCNLPEPRAERPSASECHKAQSKQLTQSHLLEMLENNNQNRSKTARQLGISRALLYKKMHLFEIA